MAIILEFMIPVINKPLIVFFSGLVVSYLELSGYVNPQNHSDNLQNTETIVGGLMAMATVLGFFAHHAVTEKARIQAGITNPASTAGFSDLWNKVSSFVFSKNTVTIPANTPAEQPAA